ncbi:MAG: tetratricopeptide repeat protein [Chitinophagales bacterium]|nr:tetratricopeptide repeat protein [Chitinophagales bacterium]MDW8394006.1 tetratricopeptide repeat protein [Chitinophagales bacterium]
MVFLLLAVFPWQSFAQVPDTVPFSASTAMYDTMHLNRLLAMAEEALDEKPEQALEWAQEAHQMAERRSLLHALAKAELLIGDYHKRKGKCQQALEYYNRSRELYAQVNYQEDAALGTLQVAACRIDLSQFEEAKSLLNWSLKEGERLNSNRVRLRANILYSALLQKQGALDQAMQHLLAAMALAETSQDHRQLGIIYTNMGSLFLEADDLDNAQKYLMRAAEQRERVNDRHGLSKVYTMMGVLFKEAGNLPQSLRYYERAYAIQKELNNRSGMAQSLQNMGIIYRNQKLPEKALQHYERALQIRRENGDQRGMAITQYNMALCYLDLGQPHQALRLLESCEELANHNSLRELLALLPEARAEALAMTGQQDAALSSLREALQARDSLYQAERLRQFDELHARYETEKKDKELLQRKLELEQKNAELQRQRLTNYLLYGGLASFFLIALLTAGFLWQRHKLERQRAIEQTRAGIARDLHDDIGATLSTVTIFSTLALKKLETDSAGALALLQRIRSVSEKMMSDMSDVIWMVKPENDSAEKLSSRIHALARQLLEPMQIRYELHLNGGEEKLSMKARRNIYLIIKEALANAAKHSQAKVVEVQLQSQNGQLLLRITDDGKGMSGRSSFGNRYLGGNGLGHMKNRAAQLGGMLQAYANSPSGTVIEATFKLSDVSKS